MLAAVAATGDHVPRNRAAWDRWAAEYAGPGQRGWAQPEPARGIWQIPQAPTGGLAAGPAGRGVGGGGGGPRGRGGGGSGHPRGAAAPPPPAAGPIRAAVPADPRQRQA